MLVDVTTTLATNQTFTSAHDTNSIYVPNGIGVTSPNTIGITPGTWTAPTYVPTVKLTGSNPIIQTDQHTINVDELAELIKVMNVMKDRLLILAADFEKHELYPALKQAYDNYKLIERMVSDGR